MVLYHPQERHGSHLLQLSVSLTFSPVDSLHGIQPPRFFSVTQNKRACLVQFSSVSRAGILAWIWSGFLLSLPSSIISIIEDHTETALKSLFAAHDLDQRHRHFSHLTPHYVNIKENAHVLTSVKGKGKTLEQRRRIPTQHSWQECFVITVSTVPVGREARAFQALLPPEAPLDTKLHPINLFGWRGEVASQLSLFRTWSFSPDPSMFARNQ